VTDATGGRRTAPAVDPAVDAYKAAVDRTLLRENLALTPTQRVENLMSLQRLAEEARAAGRRAAER
jgi:hypothetical protein